MSSQKYFYPESKFGGYTDIDGTVAFFLRVNALLGPDSVVLDLGCGRGKAIEDSCDTRRELRTFRNKVKKVIGLDVDPVSAENPLIDEFVLIDSDRWQLEESSVDLILCDNVLEHVENPERFFNEIKRVLKSGGHLCIRTPNRWGYVAIVSSLIPNRFHGHVVSRAQENRKEEDVFPTYYRCNSIGAIRKTMKKCGFTAVVYGFESEPSYFSFSRITYFFAVLHQRFAPRFLRLAIFAFGKLEK